MSDIKLINKEIILPDGIESGIVVTISDVHYGCKMCNVPFFEKVMNWCYNNEDVYVKTNGDLLECSTLSSPSLFDQNIDINDQFDYMVDVLRPLAEEDRLLWMVRGNHEKRILRETGYDIARTLAKTLNIPYFEHGCSYQIKIRQETQKRSQIYTGYMIHGATAARTIAGKLRKCNNLSDVINAEIYEYGHVHELFHNAAPYYDIDRGRIVKRRRHYILTGGYLNYGGYVQEKGYRPVALGSPKIKLHTNSHRISVSF